MTPRGIALDLRKPHMHLYWLDEGVNTTKHFNRTGSYRDGRLLRSNFDGTNPEVSNNRPEALRIYVSAPTQVVLPYGTLKGPTSMVLDLVNGTAFVGDEAGRIW